MRTNGQQHKNIQEMFKKLIEKNQNISWFSYKNAKKYAYKFLNGHGKHKLWKKYTKVFKIKYSVNFFLDLHILVKSTWVSTNHNS